jgi:hypothetical protein
MQAAADATALAIIRADAQSLTAPDASSFFNAALNLTGQQNVAVTSRQHQQWRDDSERQRARQSADLLHGSRRLFAAHHRGQRFGLLVRLRDGARQDGGQCGFARRLDGQSQQLFAGVEFLVGERGLRRWLSQFDRVADRGGRRRLGLRLERHAHQRHIGPVSNRMPTSRCRAAAAAGTPT